MFDRTWNSLYTIQAWSPWTAQDKEVLEKVQQRAIKMISGLRASEYEDRLKELGLTTLEERRHQADMAMVYKVLTARNRWTLQSGSTWPARRAGPRGPPPTL